MSNTSRRGAKEVTTGNGFKYYTISQGLFVNRVKEQTEKSVERALTKGDNIGKIVHEEKLLSLTGELLEIRLEDNPKFDLCWEIILDMSQDPSEKEIAVLKLKYSSGHAIRFFKALPNCNLNNDIVLKGYNFTPEGETKARTGFSTQQFNGEKDERILPFYTKEDMKDLPEVKVLKKKGKPDEYDSEAQLEFFELMIKDLKLKGIDAAPKAAAAETTEQPQEAAGEEEETEELPF